jgi:hypothetical protein
LGTTRAAAGCASFGSTAAAGKSPGSLSGSAAVGANPAGALFGLTAAAEGCAPSCAGRGRGSGGDDTIRWRRVPVLVTWCNQVTKLCAIPEKGGCGLDGIGDCGSCAWAGAAANNWKARKNAAAPNTLDLTVPSPQHSTNKVRRARSSGIAAALRPKSRGGPYPIRETVTTLVACRRRGTRRCSSVSTPAAYSADT